MLLLVLGRSPNVDLRNYLASITTIASTLQDGGYGQTRGLRPSWRQSLESDNKAPGTIKECTRTPSVSWRPTWGPSRERS